MLKPRQTKSENQNINFHENFSQPQLSYNNENLYSTNFNSVNLSAKAFSQELQRNNLLEDSTEYTDNIESKNKDKKFSITYKINENISKTYIRQYPPWLNKKTIKSQEPNFRFYLEVIDLCNFLRLTQKEILTREITLKNLEQILKKEYPSCDVELYGSYIIGLSLPDSDLDIALCKLEKNKNKKSSELLIEMKETLYLNKIAVEGGNIETSKNISLLRLTHRETKIKLDVVVENDNGIKASKKFIEIIKKYPIIREATILVKYILRQRSLNDSYKAGISSHLLMNMIYLFCLKLEDEGFSLNPTNIKNFLISFFKFFSEEKIWKNKIFSINNGKFFTYDKDTYNSGHYTEKIMIEDFVETSNTKFINSNINYKKISDIFSEIVIKLENNKEKYKSFLCSFIELSSDMLERGNYLKSLIPGK